MNPSDFSHNTQVVYKWQAFFEAFTREQRIPQPAPMRVFSINEAEQFFAEYHDRHTAFMQGGGAVNVLNVVGVGHDELRNCSLLAWLLDCSGSHGQGAAFLHCFLGCIHGSDCPDIFPAGVLASSNYRTTVESSYDEEEQSGRQRSRVDIELDGDTFLLFIEAKVQAGEGDRQLARYLRIGKTRAGNRPWGLVFITRTGAQPSEEILRGKVACVRWHALGRSFLHHARTMPETPGSVVIRQICEHFINL